VSGAVRRYTRNEAEKCLAKDAPESWRGASDVQA
jgi:hypothetical protein